jgi:hypothetical protein
LVILVILVLYFLLTSPASTKQRLEIQAGYESIDNALYPFFLKPPFQFYSSNIFILVKTQICNKKGEATSR